MLKELVELGHFHFGSDFPVVPARATGMETEAIDKLPMLSEAERAGIIRGNALELFPRFTGATLPEAHRLERLKRAAQERCLNEHPDVHECAIVAHELEDRRMTLSAFVCLRDGITETPRQTKQLQEYVKSKLLPYKYPRAIRFMSELPKTGTGKIDRQALLKAAID